MKKIIAAGVLLLVTFIAVEVTYRFYAVGAVALHPLRANSLNTLLRSEFVQLSRFPEIFFELKPSMKGWFKGVRFATNSVGLADREYPRSKPAEAFRMVVVGSSWTMPSGVEQQDAWHAVMEERLNEELPSQSIEVVNLGVELYGLRELVGTVRHKAFTWEPDLIVVAVTTFTSSFLWQEPDGTEQLPERAYPALESYALRGLGGMLGWQVESAANDRALVDPEDIALRQAQMTRALDELAAMSSASGVPIAVMFLGFMPLNDGVEAELRRHAEPLGVPLVFANRLFPASQSERINFQISRYDRHPNAAGHQLIADYLQQSLQQSRLLPSGRSGE